jgi:hypothetical protein
LATTEGRILSCPKKDDPYSVQFSENDIAERPDALKKLKSIVPESAERRVLSQQPREVQQG